MGAQLSYILRVYTTWPRVKETRDTTLTKRKGYIRSHIRKPHHYELMGSEVYTDISSIMWVYNHRGEV